jgi:hypothetical protein
VWGAIAHGRKFFSVDLLFSQIIGRTRSETRFRLSMQMSI